MMLTLVDLLFHSGSLVSWPGGSRAARPILHSQREEPDQKAKNQLLMSNGECTTGLTWGEGS
jgi:hypothetical protein